LDFDLGFSSSLLPEKQTIQTLRMTTQMTAISHSRKSRIAAAENRAAIGSFLIGGMVELGMPCRCWRQSIIIDGEGKYEEESTFNGRECKCEHTGNNALSLDQVC
jgi:hypothetical protein